MSYLVGCFDVEIVEPAQGRDARLHVMVRHLTSQNLDHRRHIQLHRTRGSAGGSSTVQLGCSVSTEVREHVGRAK